MRNIPSNHALLKAIAFLGTADALRLCNDASKHVQHISVHPTKDRPYDVARIAVEYKKVYILDASSQHEPETAVFTQKQTNPFLKPAKDFKRVGPKLGRQTKW